MAVVTQSEKQNLAVQTTNLLVNATFENGSFESGPNPGASLRLNPNSTAINGWIVTRNAIDYVGTYWQSSNGGRSLDLNGAGAGGIAQTFATTPGESYVVTFDMAGDPVGAPQIKQMRVTTGPGQSADFSFNVSGRSTNNMGWQTKTWVFTATSTQTTLEFYSLNQGGGSSGPALDNVSVVSAG
jgi:choice-of-anchor C domain-containing protein